MRMKENGGKPNYLQIFKDILTEKFPDKKIAEIELASEKELSVSEVLKFNKLVFGKEAAMNGNGKFRSYDKETILSILHYQKQNYCSNSELARIYNVSRNSISAWKKVFKV